MPALQSVILTDRTPVTPVNMTFVPRGEVNGVGTVVFPAAVAAGDKRLTVSHKNTGTRFKGEARLSLPVLVNETINGVVVPRVIRSNFISVSVSWDQDATEQERTDAVGMMASALTTGKVLINDAFVKNESVY